MSILTTSACGRATSCLSKPITSDSPSQTLVLLTRVASLTFAPCFSKRWNRKRRDLQCWTGHFRYCGAGCSTYPTIWSLGKAVAIYKGMLELNLFFRSFPGPNMCLILINRIHLRGSITVLVPSNSNLCDLHNVKSF